MEEMDKVKNLTRNNYKVKMYQERANMIRKLVKKIEEKKDTITKNIEQLKTMNK